MKFIKRSWNKPNNGIANNFHLPIMGYKATLGDMTCRGYQFELDKLHTIKGKVVPCEHGFHFCKDVRDVLGYYDPCNMDGIRIFKVHSSGMIIDEGDKSVCSNIRLTEEVSIEWLMTNYSNCVSIRTLAAQRGYMLNTLILDSHWIVRKQVAKMKYGLDALVHDDVVGVRCEVARQGYGLDILIHDSNQYVRTEVARQGYGLDQLIDNYFSMVRCEVARQGYGLDILINDACSDVRAVVAEQGYGLDILSKDSNAMVRRVALHKLNQIGTQND